MSKELKLKSGYKAFKTFQAIVASEQNPWLCLYKAALQKAQFYSQPSLLYQDRKYIDCIISYPDCN